MRPSISDYVNALENTPGVFRTLQNIDLDRTVYGELDLCAGNSAAIFTYRSRETGRRRFLKCYIRPNPHLRTIYDYVERSSSPLLPSVRLLPGELYVHSLTGEAGWVDLVEGEWTEGETLSTAVARAAKNHDTARLTLLADGFDDLCRELLSEQWAHGDLKPENIIVQSDPETPENEISGHETTAHETSARNTPDPETPLLPLLKLIDCDALWIPSLAGERAVETGTPAYNHPARTANRFDASIDDYPATLISASLHALALQPDLYAKFNTPDTLLFSPAEVLNGTCAAHAEILQIFADKGMAREYRMTEALLSPDLDDIHAKRFFAKTSTPAITGTYALTATANSDATSTPPAEHHGKLTSFVERGKWGFKDENEHIIIPPFWDEVLEFRDNTAKVRLACEWHEIKKTY